MLNSTSMTLLLDIAYKKDWEKWHTVKFFNVSFGAMPDEFPLGLTANACSLVSEGFTGLISLCQHF